MAILRQRRKIERKTETLQSTLTSPGGLIPMQWGLAEDKMNLVARNSDENTYTTTTIYGSQTLAETASPSTSGASLIGVSAISGVSAAADLQTTLQDFKTYIDSLSYITTIPATQGGTGINSYNTGDIIYASSPTVLSTLPAGLNGQILTLVGGVPSWQTGGGGGEVNTASNLGPGFGLFNAKVGVDLQFNSLVAGSGINMFYTDVSLTSYTIQVDESALTLNNIGGTLSQSKGGTGIAGVGPTNSVFKSNGFSATYDYVKFTELSDAPTTYVDGFSTKHANRIVKVNSGRTAVEFGPYTNRGSFTVDVRNTFDNTLIASGVTIKWEKFGGWMFISIASWSGTFAGTAFNVLSLVGSYPADFTSGFGSIAAGTLCNTFYGGTYRVAQITSGLTYLEIRTQDFNNFVAGAMSFSETSFVLNTNSNYGF